jgi:hypothetical protein
LHFIQIKRNILKAVAGMLTRALPKNEHLSAPVVNCKQFADVSRTAEAYYQMCNERRKYKYQLAHLLF